jgi:hypothetical protein
MCEMDLINFEWVSMVGVVRYTLNNLKMQLRGICEKGEGGKSTTGKRSKDKVSNGILCFGVVIVVGGVRPLRGGSQRFCRSRDIQSGGCSAI